MAKAMDFSNDRRKTVTPDILRSIIESMSVQQMLDLLKTACGCAFSALILSRFNRAMKASLRGYIVGCKMERVGNVGLGVFQKSAATRGLYILNMHTHG